MKNRKTVIVGALAAGVALLAGALVGCGKVDPPAPAPAPAPRPAAVVDRFGVMTRDFVVPGPAAGKRRGAAGLNRVGSIEVPVRQYDPVDVKGAPVEPWAELVWAHGGSFRHGGLDMPESDWVAWQFAAAGMRVFAVDYVLASESVKAPAPANDVTAAARWVADRAQSPVPLMIGGASAGAHLATLAAVALAEPAGGAELSALLLEYPTLHRVQREDASISMLTRDLSQRRQFGTQRIADMYEFHLGGVSEAEIEAEGLVAGELPARKLAQLPPVIMINAEADDLRASGEQFAEQLEAAGVPVTVHTEPGAAHGYLNHGEAPANAEAAARTMERFIAEAHDAVGAAN